MSRLLAAIWFVLSLSVVPAFAQGQKPKSAQATTPAAPAAASSVRTEQTVFDSWVVTCQENPSDKKSRRCSAMLQIVEPKSKQVVFIWTIGKTPDGVLTGVFTTPTGLNLTPGLDLKMGKSNVRKLAFVACDPARCEATMPLDEAVLREARTGDDALVTITSRDGRQINFNIVNKGFEKALLAVRG